MLHFPLSNDIALGKSDIFPSLMSLLKDSESVLGTGLNVSRAGVVHPVIFRDPRHKLKKKNALFHVERDDNPSHIKFLSFCYAN